MRTNLRGSARRMEQALQDKTAAARKRREQRGPIGAELHQEISELGEVIGRVASLGTEGALAGNGGGAESGNRKREEEGTGQQKLQRRKRAELLRRIEGPAGQVGGGARGYGDLLERLVELP